MSDSRDKSSKGDSEIGYGRPPKHAQFKPGQSGNPKGRPRLDRSTQMAFRRMLARKIVSPDGRSVRIGEAIVMQMLAAAARGDYRARTQVFALMEKWDFEDEILHHVIVELVRPSDVKVENADQNRDEPSNGDSKKKIRGKC